MRISNKYSSFTLSLLWQPRHPPHDGLVLVLVLGLTGGRLHHVLPGGLQDTHKTFKALDLE